MRAAFLVVGVAVLLALLWIGLELHHENSHHRPPARSCGPLGGGCGLGGGGGL